MSKPSKKGLLGEKLNLKDYEKELQIIIETMRSMISWGEGGSYIKADGSGELDLKQVNLAKDALKKLEIKQALSRK